MAAEGRRAELDAKIKGWEHELERLRLALARGPEELHERYGRRFTELYRAKEVVKARWEAVRGVYRPAPEELARLDEALRAMEAAWAAEQSMLAEVLGAPRG